MHGSNSIEESPSVTKYGVYSMYTDRSTDSVPVLILGPNLNTGSRTEFEKTCRYSNRVADCHLPRVIRC